MAEKKTVIATTAPASVHLKREAVVKKTLHPLFEKENYMWMIIGAVIVAIGMFVMAGGKNQDPNQFDYKLLYSFTRVTVAPILILLGLVVEIYAIFKRPKPQQ